MSSEESYLHHLDPVPREPFLAEHIREAFGILFQRDKEKQCVLDTRLSALLCLILRYHPNFLQLWKLMVFICVTWIKLVVFVSIICLLIGSFVFCSISLFSSCQ